MSVEHVREALARGDLSVPLGLPECSWLEAKSSLYRLDHPGDKAEYIKDVVELANARGGLLLIGFTTTKADGQETLTELSPIPTADVDPEKYRAILRSNVWPTIRDLRVERIDTDEAKCVLLIDVPTQRDADKPFAMPGPAVGKLYPSIAVPIRDDDGTHWLSTAELQRLLSTGWAATGGLSEQVLRALADTAAGRNEATALQAFQVGRGEPSWQRPFQRLYDMVGGPSVIGEPASELYWDGPAVVQWFERPLAADSMVICALSGGEPVAMNATVWGALASLGTGSGRDGGIAAVGLPTPGAPGDPKSALVDEHATAIDLTGGTWGKGRLVRQDEQSPWRWEPTVKTSFDCSRGRNHWIVGPENWHLRIRAYAELPWIASTEPTVGKAGRARLLAALRYCELTACLEQLSVRRGAPLLPRSWERARDPHSRQTNTAAHYECVVAGPDDSARAITARLRLQCPVGMQHTVAACAEIQFDFGPWRDALRAAGAPPMSFDDMRITVEELLDLLPSCWHAAAQIAPLAAHANPSLLPLAGPPVVEFYVQSPFMQGDPNQNLDLPNFADLSVFGEQSREDLPELSLSLTAPVDLDQPKRRAVARRMLLEMAHGFGFIDADEEKLPQ